MVITEVTDEMVPKVREFLSTRKEFGFRLDWDAIFDYRWKRNDFPYGYAIMHNGNVIGFLGTMFCERFIGANKLVYCNLSAWVVDDDHKGARSLAAALLAPALKTQNVLITSFTPNEKAKTSYERIGFKRIDHQQIAVPTLASHFEWRPNNSREVIFGPDAIESYLSERDRKILHDHKNSNQYSYLIGTTSPFRLRRLIWPLSDVLRRLFSPFSCFNICYVSDPAFLAKNIQIVNRQLWKNLNSLAVRYDARLIPERLCVLEYRMPTERLCFSSASFKASDIDDLYSELVTQNTY
jgi:hypothetical protein